MLVSRADSVQRLLLLYYLFKHFKNNHILNSLKPAVLNFIINLFTKEEEEKRQTSCGGADKKKRKKLKHNYERRFDKNNFSGLRGRSLSLSRNCRSEFRFLLLIL